MTDNAEKRNGPGDSSIVYQETLRPTWSMWLLVVIAAALGWLTLAPLSASWGIASGLVVAGVAIFGLLSSQSDITVTTTHVQVGRATIERQHIGDVTGYLGDDAFQQRGRKLHGLAFLHLRSWIKPVVRIQIEDRQDRTPYWLTSSARPEELVEALGGSMYVSDEASDEDDVPQWLIDAELAQLAAEQTEEQQKR